MRGLTITEIGIGDSAEFSKTIAECDVYQFAGITGDFNPAHVDEEYARNTVFKGRIVHGILLAGFISSVIAMKLPGPGAIYVKQTLKFTAPARVGDTITARVEVVEVDAERNRLVLKTTCIKQDDTLLVDGEALVSPRKQSRTES